MAGLPDGRHDGRHPDGHRAEQRGGAWDNAKKFIESGELKDDDRRRCSARARAPTQAAVVGDTVGDPFKDTAGPSLHVLIKLLSTITLVLAPLFISAAH